jgi:serine protease inhibitor
MLIISPSLNSPRNLIELIENLNEDCFAHIQSNLKEEMISMTLPKFRIESISRAEKSLIKSGVTDVFSPNADFTGITQKQKIHLEELVQHVTLRVDEGASSENFLTATDILQERSADADTTERTVSINRPFVYFVRDIENDVILVAGIFSQPQVVDETPVVVDVAEDNEE